METMTEGPSSRNQPEWVFNPPQNWPVEPGFIPHEGWSPDPSWGPAPEGWIFWLPRKTPPSFDGQTSSEHGQGTHAATASIADATTTGTKPKKRGLAVTAAIMALVVVIVAGVALVQLQQRAAEELAAAKDGYDSSMAALNTSMQTAEGVLTESQDAVLEESTRDDLETEIAEAAEVASEGVELDDANALSSKTNSLDEARSELDDATISVEESVTALANLDAAREGMIGTIARAREALPAAEQSLAASDGKVNDASLRDDLAAAIETLRTHVGKDPTHMDTSGLQALSTDLARAKQNLESAKKKVDDDHAEWQRAADEAAAAAALLDPAAYAAISGRDWKLVERDPSAYVGEKYIVFGKVTQFDSNTGREVFRANTDGQKQSRSYNYDINTMVIGEEDVLGKVVQGDLVKLFVSVVGPYSYETTMGGNLTVPMVKANIIEVYGSE